jgi:hypothetical protein
MVKIIWLEHAAENLKNSVKKLTAVLYVNI